MLNPCDGLTRGHQRLRPQRGQPRPRPGGPASPPGTAPRFDRPRGGASRLGRARHRNDARHHGSRVPPRRGRSAPCDFAFPVRLRSQQACETWRRCSSGDQGSRAAAPTPGTGPSAPMPPPARSCLSHRRFCPRHRRGAAGAPRRPFAAPPPCRGGRSPCARPHARPGSPRRPPDTPIRRPAEKRRA